MQDDDSDEHAVYRRLQAAAACCKDTGRAVIVVLEPSSGLHVAAHGFTVPNCVVHVRHHRFAHVDCVGASDRSQPFCSKFETRNNQFHV